MAGRATLATARLRLATEATRISEVRTAPARAGAAGPAVAAVSTGPAVPAAPPGSAAGPGRRRRTVGRLPGWRLVPVLQRAVEVVARGARQGGGGGGDPGEPDRGGPRPARGEHERHPRPRPGGAGAARAPGRGRGRAAATGGGRPGPAGTRGGAATGAAPPGPGGGPAPRRRYDAGPARSATSVARPTSAAVRVSRRLDSPHRA